MPQSKKDLRTQKQKKNVEAGIGDAKGRIASNINWPLSDSIVCEVQFKDAGIFYNIPREKDCKETILLHTFKTLKVRAHWFFN